MLCGYLVLNGVQGDPARLWIARSCAVVHRYRLSSSVSSWQCCNRNIELKRMVTAMDTREIIVFTWQLPYALYGLGHRHEK
ncbi:hypothetical protein PAHAL_2G050300 [Panicum hallii]|uniref:Uncharacterized protein n=1 Tax=Panicum hallii TaxID=206008 RepID=A0A2T8KMX1_9POAL|nr:hypothetical protein PAHAL_2G050300 [Panicum hallii]